MQDKLQCRGMSTRCNVKTYQRVTAVSTCVQYVCIQSKLQCQVMGARVQAISYKPVSKATTPGRNGVTGCGGEEEITQEFANAK